jgi:hypothetical protein
MRSKADEFAYDEGMLPAAFSAVGTHVQEEYLRLTNALMAARDREAAFGVPMYRPQSADRRKAERRADLLSVALRHLFSSLNLDLETAFKFFDQDANGSVSADEFREGLARLNIELPDRKFEALLRTVDSDGDGSIDLREFFSRFIAKSASAGTTLAPSQVRGHDCLHASNLARVQSRCNLNRWITSVHVCVCVCVCVSRTAFASEVASTPGSGETDNSGAAGRREIFSP